MYEIKRNYFVECFDTHDDFIKKILELISTDKLDTIYKHGEVNDFTAKEKINILYSNYVAKKKGKLKEKWNKFMKELNHPSYIIVYWYKVCDTPEKIKERKRLHNKKVKYGNNKE